MAYDRLTVYYSDEYYIRLHRWQYDRHADTSDESMQRNDSFCVDRHAESAYEVDNTDAVCCRLL